MPARVFMKPACTCDLPLNNATLSGRPTTAPSITSNNAYLSPVAPLWAPSHISLDLVHLCIFQLPTALPRSDTVDAVDSPAETSIFSLLNPPQWCHEIFPNVEQISSVDNCLCACVCLCQRGVCVCVCICVCLCQRGER